MTFGHLSCTEGVQPRLELDYAAGMTSIDFCACFTCAGPIPQVEKGSNLLPLTSATGAGSSKAASRLGCMTQLVINAARADDTPAKAHRAPGGKLVGSLEQKVSMQTVLCNAV